MFDVMSVRVYFTQPNYLEKDVMDFARVYLLTDCLIDFI